MIPKKENTSKNNSFLGKKRRKKQKPKDNYKYFNLIVNLFIYTCFFFFFQLIYLYLKDIVRQVLKSQALPSFCNNF